jgi:hypothetical protein
MNHTKHFICFQRTSGHCANWLIRAPSLREALIKYALKECSGAELREDGSISVDDGYGGKTLYPHPLACIESEVKVPCGGEDWHGWEIRQLQQAHWDADFTEIFCSENPYDLENYIELCRPLLRQRYPRSRAKAFVWYLNDGILVTFYRPIRKGRPLPIEVLGRYQLTSQKWPEAVEWHGSYDDILEQMIIGTVPP